ncbi:MAG: cache domain-containing protein [Selenomonas sp.]|nr:cache domain-containing protein [Selenomonas sp.]
MNLQKKSIFFFDAMLVLACLVLGIMGYRSANHGFEVALGAKAEADMRQTREILDLYYPGSWEVKADGIYKGSQRMDGAFDIVDNLGKLNGNNITIFREDTRVSTTFVKDGNRAVGTKASPNIIDIVLKNGSNYTGEAEVLGNKYFCAYEPIKDGSGKNIGMLFMGIPKADVEALQNEFLYSSLIVTVMLVLVMGALVFFVVRLTLRPLTIVQESMQRIAQGDLSGAAMDISGDDEIAQIAKNANHMKESITKILMDISDSAQQLAASSQELTASASQTAESIHQVADSVVKIAGDTESQSDSLNNINLSTADMGKEMSSLNTSSQTMQQVAEQSREGAREGHHAVSNAMTAMEKMAEQMSASSKVVETLGERSKEIGKIVETISNLADQTNLLALNAAIEAARAGEAGRGFAVVADEVRKLAEQSGEAAHSIESIISGIQNDTLRAMQAMDKGNAEVQSGTQIVQRTGEVFSIMEQHIDALYEQIQLSRNRVEAAERQTSQIMNAVQTANEFSRATANEAQTVSGATEEQTAMMHDITEASESLAALAQKLQNEMLKFRFTR